MYRLFAHGTMYFLSQHGTIIINTSQSNSWVMHHFLFVKMRDGLNKKQACSKLYGSSVRFLCVFIFAIFFDIIPLMFYVKAQHS